MTVTSVHVLRFDHEQSWDAFRQPPDGATYWHPGVTAPTNGMGVPTPDLRSWTVLACWESAEHWRQAQDGPAAWETATQAWSALMAVGTSWNVPAAPMWAAGATNPFGEAAHRVAPGPAAVVTTVGLSPDHLGDVLAFVSDAERVAETLAQTTGSMGFRLGGAEHFPSQADPFTFSLWDDLSSARTWAYQTGVHATAVATHTGRPHLVRGSFTTFSVLETRGTWSDRHVLRLPVPA